MILVLPYALPPASIAHALVESVEARAPTLVNWLSSAPARLQHVNPTEVLCTPYQAWQLQQAGFTPPDSIPLGIGWTVLALDRDAQAAPDQPVWLADFVHFSVAQQGVTLSDPNLLQLTPDEADALLDAALPELSNAGFKAQRTNSLTLRVDLPPGVCPYAPTLAAAVNNEVQSWWPQDAASRPWRKVLNAVQMVWHDHPVNQRRTEQGLPEINGLWLYGGGRPNQFRHTASASQPPVTVEQALSESAQQGDWQSWLDAWGSIEAGQLQPLLRRLTNGETAEVHLVLAGEDRLATLTVRASPRWRRWLPQRKHNWRTWWAAAPPGQA